MKSVHVVLCCCLAAIAASACDREGPSAAVASRSKDDVKAENASLAPRDEPKPHFDFDLPDGWRVRAASPRELAAFYVRGNPRLACRLTRSSKSPNLAELVDGWRRELGLEPHGDDEPIDWPAAQLCGQTARIVDLEASVERGKERKSRVALVAIGSEETYVFELCGPTDLVRLERGSFLALARSLSTPSGG